ncbi:GtrA family protein [Loktanella sp. SALINAS62]|uniref:GtrA family protein n=1 Tax=Loktanella sp. SALINAS62 TaxID=2706124 RepID=UPI001B8CFDAF|nr:GtrA family protein [Loktanella sp. SALINAS62]MBS1302065.1 GtrA family protein [Loktanella sp. SALINAS62]
MPLRRVFSFAAVGIGVALLYVALYLGLLRVGLTQGTSNALAFGLVVLVQYGGQARFTFRRDLNDPRQMLRFSLMIFAGFATSALVTGVLAPSFQQQPWAAAVVVTLILPIQNFFLMTLWVFSKPAT